MTIASLGFAVDSSQSVTATSNLDKMTAAAVAVEQALQKLSAASALSNATLAKIASSVDQANAMLAKLVAAVETGNVAQTKFAASARGVEAANTATARSSEATAAAMRQAAVVTDQATAAMQRQAAVQGQVAARQARINAQVQAQAERARARAATGVDAWGRTPDEVQAHVAATSNRQAAPRQPVIPAITPAQLAPSVQMMNAGASAASMFGAALASLVHPATLVQFALVAMGGAALEYFRSGKDSADKMTAALDKSNKAVRDLAEAYKIANFNADELGRKTVIAAEAAERISRRELERQIRQSGKEIQNATTPTDFMTFGLLGGGQEYNVDPRFAAFSKQILDLRKAMSDGKADFAFFEKIQKQIEDIAGQGYGPFRTFVDDMARLVGMKPEGIRETADILQDIISRAAEAQRRLEQLQSLNRNGRGDRLVGPARMDDAQAAGREIQEQQRRERELKLAVEQEQFEARLQQQRARTNAERLAAAERVARAESGGAAAALRVERARREELQRQEMERRDAMTERHRAQLRSIEAAKEELSLIGATAGEAAQLRYQYSEIARVREEAARRGEKASDSEIEKIKQTAAELGKVADQAAKLNLGRDLQFERDQMFRSPEQQEIAGRLRSAGLPVDFDSETAKAIKFNLELERMRDTWESVFDTARSGVDSAVDALFEGGKNIGEMLKSAGRDFARQMFDLAVTNPFKNWMTGSSLNTIADLGIFGDGASSGRGGGFGGVLGNLLGAQKAVASMQVQAASVIINGGVLGGTGGVPGLGNVSRLLSGGNDNFLPPKSLSGIGSPASATDPVSLASGLLGFNENRDAASINAFLKAGGVDLDAAQQAWCAAFVNSSLKQVGIDGSGSNIATSFLKWGQSVNPADVLRGDVLVQSNGRGAGELGGHVGLATGLTRMRDDKLQLQMLSGNTSDKVGFDWYNAGELSVRRASESLDKLATGSIDAVSGLGGLTGVTNSTMQALSQFGIGANNLGSMLSNLMTTGGGFGGNWFSNLASMFGGQGGALSHMTGISPAATAHILKGGVGLFADGTESAPPGWAWVGEKGPELMKMRGGETIRDHRTSVRMASAAANQNASRGGGMSRGDVEAIVNAIAGKLKINVKNVNVPDMSVVGDYLRTEEGEQLVMNIHRRRA